MKNIVRLAAFLCLATPLAAQEDAEGSQDHPLLSRYPGFHIEDFNAADFDQAQMIGSVMADGEFALIDVVGNVSNIEYRIEDEGLSAFQVIANYKAALDALDAEIIVYCTNPTECGGTGSDFYNRAARYPLLFGGPRIEFHQDFGVLTAKVAQGAETAHVQIVASATGGGDRRDVFQSIVTSAVLETGKIGVGTIEDVRAAIADTGTVVLEGVYFDFDTADLSAESAETLETIAAYLAENPDEVFFVVGHTDSQGSYDYNLQLSEQRAASVADALVGRGVSADRLTPAGVGPVAPIASNRSEEGQAENRRVTLVLRP